VQGNPVEIEFPNTVELHWPQHYRPAFCVIAQRYSSATLVTLRLDSRNEKFGTRVKNAFCSRFFYFCRNNVSLKLRKMK
jgi:hypothetical protein